MSKCLICENIYPANYKECPICKNHLVREVFAPQQVEKVEEIEEISPYVEYTELTDFES